MSYASYFQLFFLILTESFWAFLSAEILCCALFVVLCFWRWRLKGLAVYVCLGCVLSNIQVLKILSWSTTGPQFAGGTILFCSIFWAQDVITEFYGQKKAMKVLGLSFFASLMAALLMQFSLHAPAAAFAENKLVQEALAVLFSPAPALFAASILAYVASQALDIMILQTLKNKTGGRLVWLRSGLSSLVATLADHVLFSFLAFQVFTAQPLPLAVWFQTYIVAGYALRILLALFSPLIVYMGYAVAGEKGAESDV